MPPIGSRAASAGGALPEAPTRSQSYQEKVAARANSGAANALAAAAAGGKHVAHMWICREISSPAAA